MAWKFFLPLLDRTVAFTWQDCLKRCTDLIKKGASVFFFPEGTRSRDGKLGSFKVSCSFRIFLFFFFLNLFCRSEMIMEENPIPYLAMQMMISEMLVLLWSRWPNGVFKVFGCHEVLWKVLYVIAVIFVFLIFIFTRGEKDCTNKKFSEIHRTPTVHMNWFIFLLVLKYVEGRIQCCCKNQSSSSTNCSHWNRQNHACRKGGHSESRICESSHPQAYRRKWCRGTLQWS